MSDHHTDLLSQACGRTAALAGELLKRQADLDRSPAKSISETERSQGRRLLAAALDAAGRLESAIQRELDGQGKARNSSNP